MELPERRELPHKDTSYVNYYTIIPKVLSKFPDSSPISFTHRKLEIIAKRKTELFQFGSLTPGEKVKCGEKNFRK